MPEANQTDHDYRSEYDAYWSLKDRVGASSGDMARTAGKILSTCGLGAVLDIGSGEGALVRELLLRGVNAWGVDVSPVVVARCNERTRGRFIPASIFSLPFSDGAFDTLTSTDCLEHLAPENISSALAEIRRVTRRFAFLTIATTPDRDRRWHLTIEGRDWWEKNCFEAGFRKHPAYYTVNQYESLNEDSWQIHILLEKIPEGALQKYSLASLNAERGLHMDMLRDTGERSDAHVFRYTWASGYVRAGDRVLDAACGLGYGAHLIGHLTRAASVVGMDESAYAVDYATRSFAASSPRVEFRRGSLPDALAPFEDGSFDVILSFETLEHVEDPPSLLRGFYRLLTPGGRILISVPNDWSDESGQDPNPYHFHVYDWKTIRAQLASGFLLEDAFAQTASQCKVAGQGHVWARRSRSFVKVPFTDQSPAECEWWLMSAMKSPLLAEQPYRERVIGNIAATGHVSGDYAGTYRNPWLLHPLVNINTRVRNEDVLARLATETLAASPHDTNDYAAALCVTAYRVLDRPDATHRAVGEAVARIDETLSRPVNGPAGLRWTVSLLFVKARLLLKIGLLSEAKAAFEECGACDVRPFCVHLSTKTTEAWFMAGRIALANGDSTEARRCWGRGVESGATLLSVSVEDILINPSFPNLFNHGDGVREYTVAWDNIARCANGIHLVERGGFLNDDALTASMQTEYSVVTRDLIDARRELRERTRDLVETRYALRDRTRELVETREVLVDRTGRLERLSEANAAPPVPGRAAAILLPGVRWLRLLGRRLTGSV